MLLRRRAACLDASLTGTIKKYQDSLVASWLHPFSVYRSHEQMALRRSLAELRAMRRELHMIVAKANFDPGQPRVPPGQPGGWTMDARWRRCSG